MRPSLKMHLSVVAALVAASAVAVAATPAQADAPAPGSPEFLARDLQNITESYGRIVGPGGQVSNPSYLPALATQIPATHLEQMLTQVASPTRLALTTGNLVPGWNVGNPLRAGWNGTRGMSQEVAFLNRYGAQLRGTVYAPNPGARDPYTGAILRAPFPGVVITPGSLQGSQGFYAWLAQDLAERGYVVLNYDVQGQGTSETLPHTLGGEIPYCDLFSAPVDGNTTGCPGVPFQQEANFTTGTEDALDFFVSAANPYRSFLDRTPDPRTVTPGRTSRIAIVGHSLGAAAVSQVQGTDERVAAVVALDKLRGTGNVVPVVPALAVQSEYFLFPSPATSAPDPGQERATGYDAWIGAGKDAMVIVPRSSTHVEYTDIPLVMPASRYGQALTSAYVQAFLNRYLKHTGSDAGLIGETFRYLEPVGHGIWAPVTIARNRNLSIYYCSAYSVHSGSGSAGPLQSDGDLAGIGGCAP